MQQKITSLTHRIRACAASNRMFYAIMGLFVFESLWVALCSRYPMAFDEQQHFGVIQLHATTWSPFLRNVSSDTAVFGAISRDPSFLYHYLMSFPYRLIRVFFDSQTTQIILLRLINIALVGAGLVVFRRLLTRLGSSPLRTNVIFLCFILLPIFPLMAGQISYDNLLFLLSATVLLLGVRFLQDHRHTGAIDAGRLSWLLVICLLSSTVKYAFLPVFAAVVLCLAVVVIRHLPQTFQGYVTWWRTSGWPVKAALVGLFVAGSTLFIGSYGINIVRYHNPIPRCDAVLSVNACAAYAPWDRDYVSSLEDPHVALLDLAPYTVGWVNQMMRETFFEISSMYQGSVVAYFVSPPLPLMRSAAWGLLGVGTLAVLWDIRRIWRTPAYRLILVVTLLYTAALYTTNVQGYFRSGNPVAIHGRYLIPIMLPVIAIATDSSLRLLRRLVRSLPRLYRQQYVPVLRSAIIIGVAFCWLQGGGLVSYLIRSNDAWMWPQSQPAIQVNRVARSIIWPLTIR